MVMGPFVFYIVHIVVSASSTKEETNNDHCRFRIRDMRQVTVNALITGEGGSYRGVAVLVNLLLLSFFFLFFFFFGGGGQNLV